MHPSPSTGSAHKHTASHHPCKKSTKQQNSCATNDICVAVHDGTGLHLHLSLACNAPFPFQWYCRQAHSQPSSLQEAQPGAAHSARHSATTHRLRVGCHLLLAMLPSLPTAAAHKPQAKSPPSPPLQEVHQEHQVRRRSQHSNAQSCWRDHFMRVLVYV